eukprot:TRINITY_DN687_c0_g1_i1.p1 TRINITY_DN687_c0_g1~~TRINITY_DN687_c0_g1_i1.p1  ORF type:complete len:322 (+),score=73.13 TRINITY_DN687_c0_g1_i1:1137-2102(+)
MSSRKLWTMCFLSCTLTTVLLFLAVSFTMTGTLDDVLRVSWDRSSVVQLNLAAAGGSGRVAFVIRTNQFEGKRKERVLEWVRSFHGTNVDPWLLLHSDNVTQEHNVTREFEQYYAQNGMAESVNILALNTSDLINTFPKLEVNMIPRERWGWALQHVVLQYWWLHQQVQKYSFAWIIEDDTAFIGKMNEFVEHYESRRSDLIVHRLSKKDGSNWFWHGATSKPFADKIPNSRRYFAADHVQRWSARYLAKSVEYTQENMAATSEQATATLALWGGFDVSLFEEQHTNDAFFHSTSRINESTWQDMLVSPAFQNKLVHAVKF